MWKQMLLMLVVILPLLGEGMNIAKFTGWTPEETAYLETFFATLNANGSWAHYQPAYEGPWTVDRLPFQGGQLREDHMVLGYHPITSTKNEGEKAIVHSLIAHEWSHTFRASLLRRPTGALWSPLSWIFVPLDWAVWDEGMAEAFAWFAPEILAPTGTPTPARGRTRGTLQQRDGQSPWNFYRSPAVWMRYDASQDTTKACAYQTYCWDTELAAQPVWKLMRAACPDGSVDCRSSVFRRLSEVFYDLNQRVKREAEEGGSANLGNLPILSQEDILDKVEAALPQFRVDGMTPKVFFKTRVYYGGYRQGRLFGIAAPWVSGVGNQVRWAFTAWNNPPRERMNRLPAPQPITKGRFKLELKGGGMLSSLVVDLKDGRNGSLEGTFPETPKKAGLYKVTAYEITPGGEKEVTHEVIMVTTGPFHYIPYTGSEDGVWIWNLDEKDEVVTSPLALPPGWRKVFEENGLVQAVPPQDARTLLLDGQEFNLTGEPQVLRLNGANRWPALEVSQRRITLSPNQRSVSVRVENINPNTRRTVRWTAHPFSEGQSFFELSSSSGAGASVVAVTLKPGVTSAAKGKGGICFQTDEGVSAPCVEVKYTPR